MIKPSQNVDQENPNSEQFQTSRTPIENKPLTKDDSEREEYTDDEIPYADGKDTLLDDELGEDQGDEE